MNYTDHWNHKYINTPDDKLGWYEDVPTHTLDLIRACHLPVDAHILLIGAGTTTLVESLLENGFTNLTVNDLSSAAVQILQERLGNRKDQVRWVIDDLTHPDALKRLEKIDLWVDRAVLHFFNKPKEQKAYFDLLRTLVKAGAYALFAEFSLSGATKCSGLDVFRYNTQMLKERLGGSYILIREADVIYTMPSGDRRDYIYALFKNMAHGESAY